MECLVQIYWNSTYTNCKDMFLVEIKSQIVKYMHFYAVLFIGTPLIRLC